jgi:peptidoglycan DL-endopeptidase CwlO
VCLFGARSARLRDAFRDGLRDGFRDRLPRSRAALIRLCRGPLGAHRLLPVAIGVLAAVNLTVGSLLAATGFGTAPGGAQYPGASSGTAPGSLSGVSSLAAQPVPVRLNGPGIGYSRTQQSLGSTAPLTASAVAGQTSAASPASPAGTAQVAPLHGLKQADLLIVAPYSLPAKLRAEVSALAGVTSVDPIEAARVKVNGAYAAVLGVNPSTFRGYAAEPTAASTPLWQGVADGGIAVSYSMGTLDRLPLGGEVTIAGRIAEQLRVIAFGTVGIVGVDAVVSDPVATSLGMPAGNAIVIGAKPADVAALDGRIKRLLPPGAAVDQLIIYGAAGSGSATAGNPAAVGDFPTQAQLDTMLQAALSRRGMPYVWGAAGPSAFDCSGLVQWAFAQAGLAMPRVAAEQAMTGMAVPLSQLVPGDLLFYHTDPTDPGYISHVAIYLGNGWMIQAPAPGLDVEVVPVALGPEFAGAIEVNPRVAAAEASDIPG